MILETKTPNQRLISGEDFFFQEHLFAYKNFQTNLHENMTLITTAIAACNKLTHKYLAHNE